MSKASVAQEPSMDEILASIRRIIETGEDRGVAGTGRLSPVRDASLDAIRKEAEDAEALDEAVPAYGQHSVGLSPVPNEHSTVSSFPPSVAGQAAGSLAVDVDHLTVQLESELAASWGDFELHHRQDGLNAHPAAGTHHHEPASEAAAAPEVHATHPSFDHTQTDRREQATMSDTARHQPPIDRSSFEPANSDRREMEAQSAYGSYETTGQNPLLSSSSGQMVAASFDELAQAIRNGELKSLEAMAQDMLKPMLAEWLDDNLPRMVERLVREEIERLSRGGRR